MVEIWIQRFRRKEDTKKPCRVYTAEFTVNAKRNPLTKVDFGREWITTKLTVRAPTDDIAREMANQERQRLEKNYGFGRVIYEHLIDNKLERVRKIASKVKKVPYRPLNLKTGTPRDPLRS